MSGLSDLITALALFVPALGSTIVLVLNAFRGTRKPDQVAKRSAEEAAAAMLAAIVDGELSADDVKAIRRTLRKGNKP